MAVARALAASKAFTVVGGGESVMAVHRAGVADGHRARVDRRRRLARIHHRQGPARDRGAGGVMALRRPLVVAQLEDAHGRGGNRHVPRALLVPGRPAASMSSSALPSPRLPHAAMLLSGSAS